MKKLTLILLSLTLLACGQKEQPVPEPKSTSVEAVKPAETASNERLVIVGDAFNVTPEQFKKHFVMLFEQYINDSANENADELRGYITIKTVPDGLIFSDSHYLKWELNSSGYIKSVTTTFHPKGEESSFVSVMPIFWADASIGGDTNGTLEVVSDSTNRFIDGGKKGRVEVSKTNSEKEYSSIISGKYGFVFTIKPK